ncbi:MAG: hypothetical protein SVK08_08710 [Halobacteriota archaeon]|nr:hypothetical protein [Halobacteriota archaeon]
MIEISDFDLDVYQPIPVIYELRQSILERLKTKEEILPDIDGREETKRDVIRAILSGANPYLVSEEGTGKTRLAKSVTKLLSPIPVIKGCPYHDDPKWGKELLCPKCAESEDPAEEFGIDFISPEERFSRIQGNEYTNYAKILGIKDIQVIREGVSPTDPRAFTGTGVFHANRGILFVADLPSVPTNVQVLFHPILEERKVILEEYNIERPVDFLLIATGNPEGFAHVNKIPRPLLDRMELIPMDFPEKDTGLRVMLKEKFIIDLSKEDDHLIEKGNIFEPDESLLNRKVAIPWWIADVVGRTVRETRSSLNLDKGASIRGIYKALDHTSSSVEMNGRTVASLRDAADGLKLAMRSRIKIRADLIEFGENPKTSFDRADKIVEGIMRQVVSRASEEIPIEKDVATELKSIITGDASDDLLKYKELKSVVDRMYAATGEKVREDLMNETEKALFFHPDDVSSDILKECYYSAVEMVLNIGVHKGVIDESEAEKYVFIPKVFRPEEAQ